MDSLNHIKALVDAMMSPACIAARDQHIVYTNYEFLDMAKISQKDIRRGIRCSDCLRLDIFSDGRGVIEKALDTKENVKLRELKGTNLAGDYLSLGVSCVPLTQVPGNDELVLMVFSNLTLEEDVQEKYKVLYEKEREEREKLAVFNRRLNELVEERTKELGETHRKLKTAYSELSEELEMAKSVQTALLPREVPTVMNMEFAYAYVPTGKVGGDLYDIVVTPSGKVAILIYDVSGHGVPASLIGAMAKMLFARYLDRFTSPAQIFAEVNSYICNYIRTDHYLTAFLGLIDAETGTMVYSKAAHPSPVIYRARSATIEQLTGKGLFIGHSALANVAKYSDECVQLEQGDKVLCYTDGLTEATNDTEQMFGNERLLSMVRKHSTLPVEEFLSNLLKDHTAYTRGRPLRDDFTLLCIQVGSKATAARDFGFLPDTKPSILAFSNYEEIEKICAVILRQIDAHGYSEQDIWAAKLCIHEALINAVTHGNNNDRTKRVHVAYEVGMEKFSVSVMDEGEGFDHRNLPDPKGEENLLKGGGRGLFFMRQYMDQVEFNDRGNRIKLTKHHKESG